MSRSKNPYYCHRFPPEAIGNAVWRYHRFSLSFRQFAFVNVTMHAKYASGKGGGCTVKPANNPDRSSNVFAKASLFHVPSQELSRVLLDLDTWRDYVTAAGFIEVQYYFRPSGLPCHK